ncbi:1-deoxy-D-xylulose-5-phosphate synthase [Hahella sp. KA22]|uniref:1-deoxy-D-xylulose-5-phosphate synthase n=1 Tax=Hahella sp. KA22 TaxID=1628392 RepID=UPI0019D443BC|nr:1-deoxy-D-xylulose-5-phosphate synthase [Hahella sp. KA22]
MRSELDRRIEYQKLRLDQNNTPPQEMREARSRIMYIEDKSLGLAGPARIGRVYFSKSGKTLYYRGKTFQSLKGRGCKSNFYDIESGDEYWISGPRKDRNDRLYGGNDGVVVDEDIAQEYFAYVSGVPK